MGQLSFWWLLAMLEFGLLLTRLLFSPLELSLKELWQHFLPVFKVGSPWFGGTNLDKFWSLWLA